MNDIEHYNPIFTYRPGKEQKVADALSRMPGIREGQPADTPRFLAVNDSPTPTAPSPEEFSMENAATVPPDEPLEEDHQPETPDISRPTDTPEHQRPQRMHSASFYNDVKQYLESNGQWTDASEDVRKNADQYMVRNGELWHVALRTPVLMDTSKIQDVLIAVHSDLGHYGAGQTRRAVRMRYEVVKDFWEEGKKVLDACIPCQLFKRDPAALDTATVHPLGIQNAFSLWQIDFVGPLVKTHQGNKYLITAIDYGASTAIAWPIPTQSTQFTIEIVKHIIWTYGKPEVIFTDNGKQFEDEFNTTFKRYGIQHKNTTPGHPQTNGKVERWNHELIRRIQRIAAENSHRRKDWDLYVKQAVFAFHSHYNSRVGATPFYLQYGVEPILPSQYHSVQGNSLVVLNMRKLSKTALKESRT